MAVEVGPVSLEKTRNPVSFVKVKVKENQQRLNDILAAIYLLAAICYGYLLTLTKKNDAL